MAGATCDANQKVAPACAALFAVSCYQKTCIADAFADAGAACGTNRDAGTVTRCTAGAVCALDGGIRACIGPSSEGSSCNTTEGLDCFAPARCVSSNGQSTDGGPVVGTCTLPSGSTCN
jgi:hypothetical protein